jgi:hypothetical protein
MFLSVLKCNLKNASADVERCLSMVSCSYDHPTEFCGSMSNFKTSLVCGGATATIHKYSHKSFEAG